MQGPIARICSACVDRARLELAQRGVAASGPLLEFPHRCAWVSCAACAAVSTPHA